LPNPCKLEPYMGAVVVIHLWTAWLLLCLSDALARMARRMVPGRNA
jgi:hypothetical protein